MRRLLGVSAAALTLAAVWSAAPATAAPAASPVIPYDADSPFRAEIPAGAPVDPNNAAMVAWHKAHEGKDYPKLAGTGAGGWGMGFGVADCSDPLVRIAADGNVPDSQKHLKEEGFHAPAELLTAIPANNDAPITAVDTCPTKARPGGQTVWANNVAPYTGGGVLTTSSLSNGGKIAAGSFANDSNGLDRRVPGGDPRNERSRGAIPGALIRDDLLRAGMAGANDGTLGHLLHGSAMETNTAAGVGALMAGAESGKSGVAAEGQLWSLAADWSAPAGCTGAALVVARTLQVHGAYWGDNSGSDSVFKTEEGSTLLQPDSLGACFTWDDVVYHPKDWLPTGGAGGAGRAASTPPPASPAPTSPAPAAGGGEVGTAWSLSPNRQTRGRTP